MQHIQQKLETLREALLISISGILRLIARLELATPKQMLCKRPCLSVTSKHLEMTGVRSGNTEHKSTMQLRLAHARDAARCELAG